MAGILNRDELEASIPGNSIHSILDALEAALKASSPKRLMKRAAEGIEASKYNRILVIGAGKAGAGMALAAEELFEVSEGVVCVPRGTKDRTRTIELVQAGHPFPDEGSVRGARQILALSKKAGEKDLVLCLLSGGASALMCLPKEGITLREKAELSGFLMKAGADINELNVVRKHLSGIKGGQLAAAFSNSTLISLIISDVVGDRLETIASGPTVPDPSTFSDATGLMRKFGAWGKFPKAERIIELGIAGKTKETPKPGSTVFSNSSTRIIGNNRTALEAASGVLKAKGIRHELIENVKGEARGVGLKFARKLSNGISFVAGGETIVKVKGKGIGGRNQELSLSCAIRIAGKNAILASIGTDGIDGNSRAAGAIVDGKTVTDKKEAGQFLENNDSFAYLSRKGRSIITGLTGTNVNDVMVGISLNKSSKRH